MDHFAHCQELVAQTDRDRYLATLFAPEEKRGALYALYAFNAEIARVRELAREPMPGEIRLQWWREVLQGEREGEAAAHPVAAALQQTLRDNGLPATPLLALIDAHGFDLYDEPMARFGDLDTYAMLTEGTIISFAAMLLDQTAAPPERLMRAAGLAYGFARVLRDFAHHAARGQLYVPQEALERFGAERNDVAARSANFELRAALAEMRLRARRYLAAAADLLPQAPPAILPALLPAALIRPTLARMETANYQPFRDVELPAWRRQWLIWRAARNPQRIFG